MRSIVHFRLFIFLYRMRQFTMRVFVAGLLLIVSLGARCEVVTATVDGLKYDLDTEKGTATVVGLDEDCQELVIPASVAYMGTDYTVSAIGEWAFSDCRSLVSVVIPNTVTTIGRVAFNECRNMESVEIPSSVTLIDEGAFFGCSKLTSVEIPGPVSEIRGWTFTNCYILTSVKLPNTVTTIGECAFFDCDSLPSIEIPHSVRRIEGYAFYNCVSLKSVTIPGSVTTIGDEAFCFCKKLESVTIPGSVDSIGMNPFRKCSEQLVVEVASDNPYYCTDQLAIYTKEKDAIVSFLRPGTTSYVLPSSVRRIGDGAFGRCWGLRSLVIPDSVTYIGRYAFEGCDGFVSLDLPSALTHIGYDAFTDCDGLESVVIPASVTEIESYAFSCCSRLKNVYCLASEAPESEEGIFSDIEDDPILHVPAHSTGNYSTWSGYFAEIKQGDPEQIHAVANAGRDAHYASFSNPYSDTELTVETGKSLTLYNVKVVDGEMVLTERAGNKVAKGEGVLVCTDAADIVVSPLATTDLVSAEDNDLVATSVLPADTVCARESHVLYRLAYGDASGQTGLGFYLSVLKDQEGHVVSADGTALATNPFSAYLSVSAQTASAAPGFELGAGNPTGIDSQPAEGGEDATVPMYDLGGRRISTPERGIIIRGDRKYLAR